MITKIKAIFALVLLILSATSGAANLLPAVQVRPATAMYAVSGLLRSNDGSVVKLVQGIHLARSRDEALATFFREVLSQYPGYSLMDTVSTLLPPPKTTCGLTI